ncbi:TetR family transcriptional regulator [Sneathiella litorea]|uniref:TetR family transcriptional regulator n=1 Tax=Sneathiella litorea TaxID=2606216 RepID=A0A6L8WAN0_9PROT|nr:TetR family transcriptional regulator [Sneathiella litorea]
MNVLWEGGCGPKRIRRKSFETRKAILDAAARLFCENGYVGTTLKEIATAAGIEPASLYYYFASKEDLLDDVFDIGCRQITDAVSTVYQECEASGASFKETFTGMVREHLDQILGGSDFTAAIMRNFSILSPEARARQRRSFKIYGDLWTNAFKNAQQKGEIRPDISAITLKQLIVGALNWTAVWFDRDSFSICEYTDSTVSLLLDGLLSPDNLWDGREPAAITIEPMSPKIAGRSKAAQTRLHILLSTTRALQKKGYDGVTLRYIAEVAGIEAGSIYYHFSSKEEIIDDVLSRGLNEIAEGVIYILENEIDYPDYTSRIAAAIRTHMLYLFVRNDFIALNIRIFGQLPLDIREKHRPVRQQYAAAWNQILKQAQASGEIRNELNIFQMQQLLLGALNWSVNWYHPDLDKAEESKSLDDLIKKILVVFLDGIATEKQEIVSQGIKTSLQPD